MLNKNYIITDCVSDLSNEYVKRKNIGVIRFYLELNDNVFLDGYEISVANVVEHYEEFGTKIVSNPPPSEEYANIYREHLKNYENVIHFTISSLSSVSYNNATKGRELLGEDAKRVFIVDSKLLSSGMGFLIINAIEMNDNGCSPEEIVAKSMELIPKINVSFVSPNADNLAINGRVSPMMAKIIRNLKLRPVFQMKQGNLTIARFEFGNRNRYLKKYIRHKLSKSDKVDLEHAFVTHCCCSKDEIDKIVEEIKSIRPFKKIYICKTSATVACNCGERTFGVIYMYK